MLKSAWTKTFFAYWIAHVLFMCPTFVQADDPPGSGNADADGCSHAILERSIAEKSRPIDPRNLPIFKSEITRILDVVDQQHPDFGQALRGVLKKNWRFGFDIDVPPCPTEGAYLGDDTQKVACQSSNEVVLSPDYFETLGPGLCSSLSNKDAKQELTQRQMDIVVHEMLLGVVLQTGISWPSMLAMWKKLVSPTLQASDLDADDFYQNSPFFRLYDMNGKPCNPPPVVQPLTDVAPQSLVSAHNIANRVFRQEHEVFCDFNLDGLSSKLVSSPDALILFLSYDKSNIDKTWATALSISNSVLGPRSDVSVALQEVLKSAWVGTGNDGVQAYSSGEIDPKFRQINKMILAHKKRGECIDPSLGRN
jgi:hypothetical protein